MRTILLLLGTVVLLVGGFALYWMMQSRGPARLTHGAGDGLPKPLAVQQSETTYTVGGGKGVWLKQYDQVGRLTNQFKADEYDPQKEGFVRVAKPEARFFMKGGQWIKVTGNTGDVFVSGLPEAGAGGGGGDLFAPSGASGGGPAGTPSRGRLRDVRIGLYETPDAMQPSIEMEMHNAAFDNESFRIHTEAYTDAGGKQVAADQVKVTVRGKYEFDGQGLTIRWNDRDQRLELLEIAHGERLVIKEPGLIRTKMPGKPGQGAAPSAIGPRRETRTQAGDLAAFPLLEAADPLGALASADPAAAAQAVEPESNHYILFLYDNVQMLQGEETIAVADSVEVHYAARNTPQARKPPTAAPAPAPQPAPQAPAPPDAPEPATQPAAEPQQPVTVYWTGKLRITPSVSGPPVHLAPEQAAVQMRGTPVVLTNDNTVIKCPALTYRTSDGGATLHTSEAFPQVQIAQYATAQRTGDPEMTLYSQWLEYDPEGGVATLGGKSRAEFPADDTPAGDVAAKADAAAAAAGREMARVTWNREGIVRFAPGVGGEQGAVQDLRLAGDVNVEHPQVSLQSQKLSLAFAPPSADEPPKDVKPAGDDVASRRMTIKQVTASDSVHCVLPDGEKSARELTCDHLDLATALDPAGKLYANVVKAHGNVRAIEEGQELTTEDLELTLLPATAAAVGKGGGKPAFGGGQVELQRLVAKTRVRAVSKDGAVATGNSLVVTNADGKAIVGLSGKPAKMVSAEGNVLTSEKIVAMPDSDEAQALGPGSLRAAVKTAAGETPRFMEASWTESAIMNGSRTDDQIQITGDVKASLPEADGTVNTARAHRILITMADKEPSADAGDGTEAKEAGAKTKKGDADNDDARGALASANADVMKGREVSRIVLVQDAVVDRRLRGEDGSILREMQIESSLLHYNVKAERFIAPRPGRMLVRDHTDPADERPAPGEALASAEAAPDKGAFGEQRGATAFQWAGSLDYDGAARRASMKQDVVVAFRPDGENQVPVQLRSDNVVAEFEAPDEDPAAAAAAKSTKSAKAGEADALVRAPAPKLRTVTAEGNVNVVRGDQELSATKLTYTPARSTIVATGSKANPTVFSRAGRADLSATEIHWNTETWDVKVVGAAARIAPTR